MAIKNDGFNLGRIVYLIIGKSNKEDAYSFKGDFNNLFDKVTIAFDPKNNPQLNTRIDFLIRHQFGSVSSVTGAACSLASIDLYNIGPALQQFMNAYNATQKTSVGDVWSGVKLDKYVCALQVGHYGGDLKTIFSGVINSYNVERKQTSSTIDTVWHLLCAGTGGYDIVPMSQKETATSGTDYLAEAQQQNQVLKTFTSGEEYIKYIVMSRPRSVFVSSESNNILSGSSFEVSQDKQVSKIAYLETVEEITNQNFNKYFEIRYRAFNAGEDEKWTKNVWKYESIKSVPTIDPTNLAEALDQVAKLRNCHAELRQDENIGKQYIYIYSTRAKSASLQKEPDFVINNFQNLRKPPMVSGKSITFDMMLQPDAKPNDTFELRITDNFLKTHQNALSFSVSFDEGIASWSSVFAGSNFDGLSNSLVNKKTNEAMEQTGNVFNKKFVAMYITHQGSTHEAEWSTQAYCVNVIE